MSSDILNEELLVKKYRKESWPVLKEITFESQNLSYVDARVLYNCPQLDYFSLYFNKIRTLDEATFAKSVNLTRLRLSANHLEDLSPLLLASCPNLSLVFLSYNKLSKLHPDLFAQNFNLTECYLNGNLLSSLDGQVFRNCSKLKKLDLTYNKFGPFKAEWLHGLVSLEAIHIQSQGINEINEFKGQISTDPKPAPVVTQ